MLKTKTPAAADGQVASNLLSRQVRGSRYFFLNLGPAHRKAGARAVLALGGKEQCNPDYRVERESFAYDVFEYIVEGEGWVRLAGGVKQSLGPGTVFVSPRASACALVSSEARPLVKYFLCFSGETGSARLKRAGLSPKHVRTLAAHGEIGSVLADLVREGQRPGPKAAPICDVLFELLALKIEDALPRGGAAGKAAESEAARESFLRAKGLIDAQADKLATLEEVAAALRLDVSSVCRLFRRFQGISPYQYLLRRKMNLAAEFLVDGQGLVKDAAQLVGFADPYHFSRCFKAVHGVPPSGLQRRGATA